MKTTATTIGIVGVGKLGTALGRLVIDAGCELVLAGRPGQPMLDLIVSSLLPEAQLVDFAELAARADITILAVPRPALAGLDLAALRGIVIDATNAWEATDGIAAPAGAEPQLSGTCWLAGDLLHLAVVRTLNHAAYTDLAADARPAGAPGRRALGVAGDDPAALEAVAALVDRLGFDPVVLGPDRAHLLDVDGPVFGRRLERAEFESALADASAPASGC
ncbi:NAD(P)-binding domain-containing protein [Brevibacterium sp. NPDC049920]|uniref:Pyrroline-5-carboxylate reductase catalytic N-terminal domain-containing protein n=2 Tax=Brevibacterium TaxID=1696 RepID=A0ABP8J3L3_9MICO